MNELVLERQWVLIREDLNVPISDGKVANNKRLRAALPTIEYALQRDARVVLLSHLGRPQEGLYDTKLSLEPVADELSEMLGRPVPLARDWLDGLDVAPGSVVLCENVRFEVGENKNDVRLARRIAALCDIYVMDAFGTAHREDASTYGVGWHAPIVCAGPLLVNEVEALERVLENLARPVVAIIGGSKISTKFEVLSSLASSVDELIVGGGIANTLLAAAGVNVGESVQEVQMRHLASQLLDGKFGDAIVPLPTDVVVGKSLDVEARGEIKWTADVVGGEMILDIGPDTALTYAERLGNAGTILWNGPVGVFECPEFAEGTRSVARAVAASKAFSIAGGGDTLAAIERFDVMDDISLVSTGGGALLEFFTGKKLPALEMLGARA